MIITISLSFPLMRLFRDNIDCKTVRILRIQVRASSETKSLERGGRVRLARFARVRL